MSHGLRSNTESLALRQEIPESTVFSVLSGILLFYFL
jgi:hypothetical protein